MTSDIFLTGFMQKHFVIGATLAGLLLAGCNKPPMSANLDEMMKNPLFAERYAEGMVDTLTELEIDKDPVLQEKGKKAELDAVKKQWLAVANASRTEQHKGMGGTLITMGEFGQGEVFLKNNVLYFGTDFESVPGPSLHVYLSSAIDPRDVKFPDESALDLGLLPVPYGAQTMGLPKHDETATYRTLVLWDTSIPRLYSFSQLSPT